MDYISISKSVKGDYLGKNSIFRVRSERYVNYNSIYKSVKGDYLGQNSIVRVRSERSESIWIITLSIRV